MGNNTLTAINRVKVGHVTDTAAKTGCTVILLPPGSVASVDVRGAAPGTRETDLLAPENSLKEVHAITFSGGSAFGLDAASGVMQYLYEKGIGVTTISGIKIPIVPAAILFDLNVGSFPKKSYRDFGYEACQKACEEPVQQGSVGAGTGATVGKFFGIESAMQGGIGSHCITLSDGTVVSALVAVNACGDVVDPKTGKIVAGARGNDKTFFNTVDQLTKRSPEKLIAGTNTTLALIATNAPLTKTQLKKLAQMSHDGLSWTIRPAHTMYDGDAIFAVSSPEKDEKALTTDLNILGVAACQVLSLSILKAVELSN